MSQRTDGTDQPTFLERNADLLRERLLSDPDNVKLRKQYLGARPNALREADASCPDIRLVGSLAAPRALLQGLLALVAAWAALAWLSGDYFWQGPPEKEQRDRLLYLGAVLGGLACAVAFQPRSRDEALFCVAVGIIGGASLANWVGALGLAGLLGAAGWLHGAIAHRDQRQQEYRACSDRCGPVPPGLWGRLHEAPRILLGEAGNETAETQHASWSIWPSPPLHAKLTIGVMLGGLAAVGLLFLGLVLGRLPWLEGLMAPLGEWAISSLPLPLFLLLVPGCLFGSIFLALVPGLLFARYFPAGCPRCGGAAFRGDERPTEGYSCGRCGHTAAGE